MWNDLRFALRTLRRSPGFSLVAVLSLALGIGANTAIFSLLYQVVLRSVPVQDPQSLVALESNDYNLGWTRRDNNRTVFSYPLYRDLRDRNTVFTGLIGRASFPVTLLYRGDAVAATAEVVTGNFFNVLGLRPALGRPLEPADDGAPGASTAIVLSYSYWATHLGSTPGALNSQMLLNGHPVVIVGVAPRGFRGLLTGQTPDIFAPAAMLGMIVPGWKGAEKPDMHWLSIFGRLRPGVTPQRASAALLPLYHAVMQDEIPRMSDVSAEARQKLLAKPMIVESAAQGVNELRTQWQAPLAVLMVMVGLVLLIACANVANLLVARATARQREIAVRLAIGAGRWQLARQLLVESTLLAVAGGVLGLLLSGMLAEGLLQLLPTDATGGWLNARLDPRLLVFSLALALVTGLLFGLIPALQASRAGLVTALREQSAGTGASGGATRIRQVLVVAQIAISLLLLVGAGLFTRSLLKLTSNDPGFRADHMVTVDLDPGLSGYSSERSLALFRDLQDRLRSLPGVTAVTTAEFEPFGGFGWGSGVKALGSSRGGETHVACSENSVGPGFFAAFGIPLLEGREFTAEDNQRAPKVAILNRTLARALFDNDAPIGRHIQFGARDEDVEVVGVVKESKYGDIREKPTNFIYVPYEQGGDEFTQRAAFFVRTSGPESGVMPAIRSVVKQLDRDLPIQRITSMRVLIDDSIYTDRLLATLAIAFGILATVLAAVGLYGTISYSVARRTREFGVRLALGAAPASLLTLIMREMARMIVIGVAVALFFSYVLARFVESQLYGVHAHDPLVLVGGTLLIIAAAVMACLGPAVRAMRIEPIGALRYE